MTHTELDALQKDPLVKSYLDTNPDGSKTLSYYHVTSKDNDRYDVSSELVHTYDVMNHVDFKNWTIEFHGETLAQIEERGNAIILELQTA